MFKRIKKLTKKTFDMAVRTVRDKMVEPVWDALDELLEDKYETPNNNNPERFVLFVEKTVNNKKEKVKVLDLGDRIDPEDIDDLRSYVSESIECDYIVSYGIKPEQKPLIRHICSQYNHVVHFYDEDDDDDEENTTQQAVVRTTQGVAAEIERKIIHYLTNNEAIVNLLASEPRLTQKLNGILLKNGVFNNVLVKDQDAQVVWDRGLYNRKNLEEEGLAIILNEELGMWDTYGTTNWVALKLPLKFWRELKEALNDLDELK